MSIQPRTTTTTTVTEVVLPGIVEPGGLQVLQRQLGAPGPGRARVAMEASGVSFAEQQMRRGKYFDQPPFPFVPGYDLVGTVADVGAGVDPSLVGQRVAAVTKTGAWASAVDREVDELVVVPRELDPTEIATLVVNGITARQMLRRAKVHAGSTVLVLGANGGVGTTLVQLARHAGARVIGTASPRHHDALITLGAIPVDYAGDVSALVRKIAPAGVDAVFDHVGGPGIVGSWRMLARGGSLVSYGTASTKNETGSSKLPVLTLFTRLAAWNALPNGRSATFYNFWAGARNRSSFYARLREDLTQVVDLLERGELSAQVAARFPLDQAAAAMTLAESRTVAGKVVLVNGAEHP